MANTCTYDAATERYSICDGHYRCRCRPAPGIRLDIGSPAVLRQPARAGWRSVLRERDDLRVAAWDRYQQERRFKVQMAVSVALFVVLLILGVAAEAL